MTDRQTDKEREREEEMNIWSSIILHVQEVLSNFHRILTIEKWTRILGHTLSTSERKIEKGGKENSIFLLKCFLGG